MWLFWINFILLMSSCKSWEYFFGVSLELCDEPIEDKPCTLTCISKYFVMAKSLVFMKDNYEYASCTIDKVSSLEDETWKCTYNYPGRRFITHQTRWSYFVYLNITHLSRTRDQGSWTCQFTGMRSTPKALTVLTTIPVSLELCKEPIKDKPCAIKCTSRYFRATKSLVFKKDNTEYAVCKVDDISLPWNCTCYYPGRCFTTKQYHWSDHVFLNITQLNRARDQGLWTCQFKGYKSEAHDLAVLINQKDDRLHKEYVLIPADKAAAPTHTCMSGDTNINFCTAGSSATYDATITVTCSSAVNISAVISAPITGSSYTERLVVTKGSMCSDPDEHVYTAVYTIPGTTALTGSGNTLTFETQLSGGIGVVHRDVFASNIIFTCL